MQPPSPSNRGAHGNLVRSDGEDPVAPGFPAPHGYGMTPSEVSTTSQR
jgi:hypothetical protein